jgi:phage terminase small subunit
VNQQQFIAALIAGNAIIVAAKVAGISERTAHNWLKQPAFYKAYQDAKQLVFDTELSELRECKKLIREMLLKHINAEVEVTPASQIQAAKLLIEQHIVAGEITQIKRQLEELQETLQLLATDSSKG